MCVYQARQGARSIGPVPVLSVAPKNTPAAGAKGGPAPLLATIRPPEFLILRTAELARLLNVLRDDLSTRLYLILLAESEFDSGEVLTSYARLMDLCAPPVPEKGRRRPGPTYKQMRCAVDRLVDVGLLRRNATTNEAQGMLRLKVPRRKKAQAL